MVFWESLREHRSNLISYMTGMRHKVAEHSGVTASDPFMDGYGGVTPLWVLQ